MRNRTRAKRVAGVSGIATAKGFTGGAGGGFTTTICSIRIRNTIIRQNRIRAKRSIAGIIVHNTLSNTPRAFIGIGRGVANRIKRVTPAEMRQHTRALRIVGES